MKTRVISAVLALALLVPCLVMWGTLAVEWLVGLVMLVGLYEFSRMALPGRSKAVLPLGAAGALLYASALDCIELSMHHSMVLSAVFLLLWSLFQKSEVDEAFLNMSKLFLGLVWVVLGATHIALLAQEPLGVPWVVLLLLIIFAGDTGAYFSGRAFGRRKLYERVSPKKTWAGVYGGLVASTAATIAFAHYELPELAPEKAVGLAILVGSAGVCGDLVESLVKRACGVKDSGSIMPGHGGALDRIDSLLLGAPVMYVLVDWWVLSA